MLVFSVFNNLISVSSTVKYQQFHYLMIFLLPISLLTFTLQDTLDHVKRINAVARV